MAGMLSALKTKVFNRIFLWRKKVMYNFYLHYLMVKKECFSPICDLEVDK